MSLVARALAILVFILLAGSLAAGTVTATPPTPAGGGTWDPNQQVKFRWKERQVPPAWARSAIVAAAKDNNDTRGSRAAILSQQDDALSWFAYTADVPSGYAIAYTVSDQTDYFHIRIRPHGFVLDWGTLRWCQFYDSPPNGCYDLELVSLHEIGHVQSLRHADEDRVTEWVDTVMHAAPKSKARVGWNQHEYGSCDVARLQIRYRPLTPSTRYSECLDLATDLTLSVSATQLAAGDSVTFTARLKVDSDAIYPNLAGQPVSDRTIELQRRVPGALTWSTVAEMIPSAITEGVYLRTSSPAATYEWRVRFPESAEGLAPAGSNVVRLSVSSGWPDIASAEPQP